jgi:hypothetical protein
MPFVTQCRRTEYGFERDPSNPVFAPTGDWNNGRAIDADVIPWRGELLLSSRRAIRRDGADEWGGFRAATCGRANPDFGRGAWRQRGEGPIMKPSLPWERKCIEAAAVCIHDDRLWMFYGRAYNNEPQQVGCTVCPDGDPTLWERVGNDYRLTVTIFRSEVGLQFFPVAEGMRRAWRVRDFHDSGGVTHR